MLWSRNQQEEGMKGTIKSLVGTLIVGAALGLPVASFAQVPGQLQRQRRNNFPVVHGAIQQLQQTKAALQNDAASDFHGHKGNAINHIDAAIQELKLGIQSDRAHPH
jgi:hypothetical protein